MTNLNGHGQTKIHFTVNSIDNSHKTIFCQKLQKKTFESQKNWSKETLYLIYPIYNHHKFVLLGTAFISDNFVTLFPQRNKSIKKSSYYK